MNAVDLYGVQTEHNGVFMLPCTTAQLLGVISIFSALSKILFVWDKNGETGPKRLQEGRAENRKPKRQKGIDSIGEPRVGVEEGQLELAQILGIKNCRGRGGTWDCRGKEQGKVGGRRDILGVGQ